MNRYTFFVQLKNDCAAFLPKRGFLIASSVAIFLALSIYSPAALAMDFPNLPSGYLENYAVKQPQQTTYHQAPSPTPSSNYYANTFTSLPQPTLKTPDDYLLLPYYQKLQRHELTPWQATLFGDVTN